MQIIFIKYEEKSLYVIYSFILSESLSNMSYHVF